MPPSGSRARCPAITRERAGPAQRRRAARRRACDGSVPRRGPRSVLDDELTWNPAGRRLAAEPAVDRGTDIGELALVDASARVLPFDIGKQERVLARMVRGRRRRIAAVVRGEDEEILRPQRVE